MFPAETVLTAQQREKNDLQLEANQSFDNNSTDFKTAEFKLSKVKPIIFETLF